MLRRFGLSLEKTDALGQRQRQRQEQRQRTKTKTKKMVYLITGTRKGKPTLGVNSCPSSVLHLVQRNPVGCMWRIYHEDGYREIYNVNYTWAKGKTYEDMAVWVKCPSSVLHLVQRSSVGCMNMLWIGIYKYSVTELQKCGNVRTQRYALGGLLRTVSMKFQSLGAKHA